MVPHCSAADGTASEDIKTPDTAGEDADVLKTFRFRLGLPFSPSVPMKFWRLPQIEATTGPEVVLVSAKRRTATGIPLASASPGTSGLNACRRTVTGTSGSWRKICPSG